MKSETSHIDSSNLAVILIVLALTALSGVFISQAPFGISFLVLVSFALALAAFMSSEVALYLLIVSMLLSPEFMLGSLSSQATLSRGITIRFDDLLVVIIGGTWFLKCAIRKELGLFFRTSLNRPMGLYIAVCLLATLLGAMMGRVSLMSGIFFVLKYFEYFIVYFMAVNHISDKKQIERFIAMMLCVSFIICIIAILQIPGGERVSAPFEGREGEPNTLGGYLLLMLSITLGLIVTYRSTGYKNILVGLVVLMVVSILATMSRSTWLAMGPMVLTLLFFSRRKMIIIIPLVLFFMVSPFVLPESVKERALHTVTQPAHRGQIEVGTVRLDTSTSERINAWRYVLKEDFIKHPFLGFGVTGYRFLDAQYPRVLIETGILGFVAFWFLIYSIYRNAFIIYREASDPFFSGIALGYIAGFVGLLVHAIGTNTFIIVRIMEPFWFLTAVVIMIPIIESESTAGAQQGIMTGEKPEPPAAVR